MKRERYIFDLHDQQVLLNINRPHTTCIEKRQQQVKYTRKWTINNEIQYKQYQKIYQENNRLYFKTYSKKYYHFNKLMQELPFYKVKCFMSF